MVNGTTTEFKLLQFSGAVDQTIPLDPNFSYLELTNKQIIIKSIKTEFFTVGNTIAENFVSNNVLLTANLLNTINAGKFFDPLNLVRYAGSAISLRINGTNVIFQGTAYNSSIVLNMDNLNILHPEKVVNNGIEWIVYGVFNNVDGSGAFIPNCRVLMEVYLVE